MAAAVQKETIKWHLEALPRATKKALDFLSKQSWLKRSRWYLAGGTALSLQCGQRVSVDLDFFTTRANFNLKELLGRFQKADWQTDFARERTVYARLNGAKVSFIAYPFFIPAEPPHWYGQVRVLDARDIAVMKITAINQRGRKRDFFDLYWYLNKREPLKIVIARLKKQYPSVAHNYHHLIKALVYFADAEADPTPKLRFKATWWQVKNFFTKETAKTAAELLALGN